MAGIINSGHHQPPGLIYSALPAHVFVDLAHLIFLNLPLLGRYLSKSGVVSVRNIVRSMGDRMVMFLSAPGLLILTEILPQCHYVHIMALGLIPPTSVVVI